ncbi:phasin family protein [Rugamonas apoptosis]|uniref:Phasin family protein n=1 Tax=Rugamonas apoptosis TaxID=2758570 RepID=A0A7W2FBN4_9BURK|nr:phasin family protein [Rugamonas apoptosis]MBA5688750.1 phasin family protein [Rugamonas apoptosis]
MVSASEQFTAQFPTQLPAASRAQVEAQLDFVTSLAQSGVDSVAKLTALNIGAIRTVLDEYPKAMHQRLAAATPQEWLATASAQMAPTLERAVDYGRQLAELTLETQTAISRAAQQAGSGK